MLCYLFRNMDRVVNKQRRYFAVDLSESRLC
jgi:hypothetical protein